MKDSRDKVAEIILYHGKDLDYYKVADQILALPLKGIGVGEECPNEWCEKGWVGDDCLCGGYE